MLKEELKKKRNKRTLKRVIIHSKIFSINPMSTKSVEQISPFLVPCADPGVLLHMLTYWCSDVGTVMPAIKRGISTPCNKTIPKKRVQIPGCRYMGHGMWFRDQNVRHTWSENLMTQYKSNEYQDKELDNIICPESGSFRTWLVNKVADRRFQWIWRGIVTYRRIQVWSIRMAIIYVQVHEEIKEAR